jgi:nitrogen regulatory protein PII-like uncharacterized protein
MLNKTNTKQGESIMTKLYVAYFNGKYPAKFRVREFSKKDNANTFIKEIKDKGGKASFTQTCFGAEKERANG